MQHPAKETTLNDIVQKYNTYVSFTIKKFLIEKGITGNNDMFQ